jgi:DNA/RNA endonuclease G (NUC1)
MTVSGLSKIGSQYQMQLGNPSSSTADPTNHKHYLIQRDQYAMDYSDELGEPNWVSWDLSAEDIGSSGRSNFIQDTTLPASFYQVKTTDYSGSGYDRGHMCPSADRTVTAADNQVLFYMSNMVPQAPDNNQGVWNNFESYCRSLATNGTELLIISGPSLFNGSRVPTNAAAIPGDVWKIVVVVPAGAGTTLERINASTRVIAISIPNIAGIRSDPWQNYITSVAQIEADTGFHFFGNLPADVANSLRVAVDGQSSSNLPVITTQPVSQSAPLGGSASFTVAATGTGALSYQWFKDGELVPGATGTSLSLTGVTLADVGSYDVVVTNATGSTVSRAADLTISGLPPGISSAPASQVVNAGSSLTLSVVATGSAPFSYQWSKDGSDIVGATSPSLILSDVQLADAGSYTVTVSNTNGSLTSSPAVLTVTEIAPVITVQPASKTGALTGSVSLTVTATGTKPMSYQWRKGGAALSDDARYSGSASAQLSISGLVAGDAGNYDVVVSNVKGSVTSSVAALTVSSANITWDFTTATPLAATVPSGLTVSSVTQGNNNGTTTMLTTTSASSGYSGASGTSNAGAAARIGSLNMAANGSAYFEWTLTPAAGQQVQVTGVTFGSRSTGTGPQAYAIYSSLDAYSSVLASGTVLSNSAWALQAPAFKVLQGAVNTPVTLRIYGYGGTGSPAASTANWRIDDLKVSALAIVPPPAVPTVVSTNPVNGATGVAYNTGITVTFDQPVTLSNAWFTLSSSSQGIMAASVTGGPSVYTINPPSAFQLDDQVSLVIHADQVADRATGLLHPSSDTAISFRTAAPQAPGISAAPAPATVTEGAPVSFSVTATGSAPFSYQWRKDGVALSGNATATTALLSVGAATLADAGAYDCVVGNSVSSITSPAATLTVNPLPPSFTLQPISVTQAPGSEAIFLVTVKSGVPVSYQWRHAGVVLADSPTVSGANSAELHVANVDLFTAGQYDVVVSSVSGSVTSNRAMLSVSDAAVAPVAWNFALGSATPSAQLPYITGGVLSQGNNNGTTALLTTTSASSGYSGSSGTYNAGAAARIGALNTLAGGSAYFEFTLTPAADRQLLVSGLSFGSRSTGTGPQALVILSSLDGFTAPLHVETVAANSSWSLKTIALPAQLAALGQSVTLRIYGCNGTGGAAVNTANWRIDDLQVFAKTIAVAPAITSAPVSQALTVGDSLNLSVAVSGSAPFTYQWRKDGALLSTANGPTLTVASVRSADAGAYDCIVSNDGGSLTSPVATVSVAKALVALGISGLDTVYDGSPKPVSVSTAIPVAALLVSYEGQPAAPVNAGSYAVNAVIDDPDYQGSASAVLVIAKAPAQVALSGLDQVFTGLQLHAGLVTSPVGLPVDVRYNGGSELPLNAGSYAVSATITDPNYVGSASGTLTVAKAPVAISIGDVEQVYDGTAKSVTVGTTPASIPVSVTYNGSVELPVNTGSYAVAVQVTDPNREGSATATLVISKAKAQILLRGLVQPYDGTPRPVVAETVPAGLKVVLSYDGSATAPTLPGVHAVSAVLDEANYSGSTDAQLRITTAALVRHAPVINGEVEGSVQVLLPESITLNGSAALIGDLLVPGVPALTLNGKPSFGGVVTSTGSATPTGHRVTLNGGALLRHLVTRVDAITMPVVAAPVAPTGTRSVTLNNATQTIGDAATLLNLTLNGNGAQAALPAGAYGYVTLNGNSVLTLGVAGSETVSVYDLRGLTLNGSCLVRIAGPVLLTVGSQLNVNSVVVGSADHPEWLMVRVYGSGLTLNGASKLFGSVLAPDGTVTINGSSILQGELSADRLTINGSGLLEQLQ